jgi:2-polyprenyl-3-methyl-5-hydroxy-6-metoxy-1,4-benzoquinol methylase
MESPCPLCGNQLFEPLRARWGSNARTRALRRCRTCGLVSVREMPAQEELRAIYGEAYFRNARSEEVGYDDYEADRYCIVRTANRRLDIIEKHLSHRGRLLDVGCALGFFVEAARRRGYQAQGVDISEHAVAYARDRLGVEARAGTIHEAGFAPGSFDVITAWDVIEHVPDPVAELRYMRSLLAEDGLLVLSTPDVGSMASKLTGSRWMGFKLAEEHLVYFDRNTVTLALAQGGFEVERLKPIGKDVSLEFFTRRLRMYAGPLARLFEAGVGVTRLGRASVYANPRDILMVIARRG